MVAQHLQNRLHLLLPNRVKTIARFNPLTYLLDAMRAMVSEGWEWGTIGKGLLAILIVGVISQSLALAALRGRVNKG